MSDDSFIREVDEEMRQDQARALWKRFGPVLIGAAVALVVATAAWRFYQYTVESKANASGDRFLAALELAADGKTDEAAQALEALQKDGYGSYPVLARMREATLKAQSGDAAGAVVAFDAVAADTAIPDVIRDMARLRAGLLLVDSGSYADVAERVEPLTGDANALRFTAREALGLAAWKAGDAEDARKLFEQISGDVAAPRALAARAGIMLELIRSGQTASNG
ncbi:MAG: tetratricopeptide repeat protein [Brucellaceae bacterium]|nr:tetratricopeptide repeat protein [Brucellaceae bacterium]